MSTVEVDGRALHVGRRGEGPPLLLLAGVGAHHALWPEPFLAALAAEVELLLLDHRGTGASGRERRPFTVADLAADAAAVLERLEVGPAHVLGFSLGGMVAQELALAQPPQVARLVLAGTMAGGPDAEPLHSERFADLRDAMAQHDPARAVRAAWEANVSAEGAQDEARFAEWVRGAAAHPMAGRVFEAQLELARAHDAAERVGSLAAPTLVLHGERDAVVAPANARRLADLLPDARLALVPGAGHFFAWEASERSAGLVLDFLRGA